MRGTNYPPFLETLSKYWLSLASLLAAAWEAEEEIAADWVAHLTESQNKKGNQDGNRDGK